MAHVVLKGVTKRFEEAGVPAVRDVSFEVQDREFMVLVGPSGCGKSTTLRMIAGLEEVSEGEIHIDGRRINDVPPNERDIAMVFQNYALYPHMTVRENLAFSLTMRKTPKAMVADRVSEAARILGIGDLLDRRPKALSGGQRQRVALGRALVREPKVFLFDEPLSNLDARLRVQMRAELVKLHEALGATVIYVTHDQVEAMTMGSRIAVMDAGAVQQVDRPLKIYRRPANAFVAGFIGSPAMNFIEGRVSPDAGALRFTPREGGWSVPLPAGLPVEGAEQGSHSVRLGVRPEHLHLSEEPGPDTIPAEVELSEPLGYDTYLTCRVGPDRLVVRAPGDTDLSSGTPVVIALEGPGAHLFDPVTGQRV